MTAKKRPAPYVETPQDAFDALAVRFQDAAAKLYAVNQIVNSFHGDDAKAAEADWSQLSRLLDEAYVEIYEATYNGFDHIGNVLRIREGGV